MKARHYFMAAAILMLAACQRAEVEKKTPATLGDTWTLTIRATKPGADTKALDLVNDGTRLNAYWKNTEKVKVYNGGSLLGTLDVTPDAGEKPTGATLSGTIATAGLAAGNQLVLRIPRESWDYSGQLGTLANIEAQYDYASATVTIASLDDVNHTFTTTGSACFGNLQSIYRFGFKTGGEYFDPKSFSVSAAGEKLVQGMTWNGSAWTPAYGSLSVTPASAPADHFFYVSLRNELTSADTYSFAITGPDDALYVASQDIPASVLDAPGKFISVKNIAATKASFAPAPSGEVDDPEEIF